MSPLEFSQQFNYDLTLAVNLKQFFEPPLTNEIRPIFMFITSFPQHYISELMDRDHYSPSLDHVTDILQWMQYLTKFTNKNSMNKHLIFLHLAPSCFNSHLNTQYYTNQHSLHPTHMLSGGATNPTEDNNFLRWGPPLPGSVPIALADSLSDLTPFVPAMTDHESNPTLMFFFH